MYRRVFPVAVVGLAVGAIVAYSQSLSLNRLDFSTASGAPVKVAIADFNNDGKNDIAYLLSGGQPESVVILLGNGNGTFATPKTTVLGTGAGKNLAVGDLNNDGLLDVVTDGFVLLGNGDGTFQKTVSNTIGGFGITVGDFNHDGKADLAIITNFSGAVTIYAGNGDGTFMAGSPVSTGGNGSDAITAADFNGDGRLDFATVNQFSSDVSVLLGRGDGTFNSPVIYPLDVASGPTALAVSDVDGDGALDIVASETGGIPLESCGATATGVFRVQRPSA